MSSSLNRQSDAGYSLIEIMVALFIVGLTTSFVVLSLPRGTAPIEKAKTGFERQIKLVRDISQSSGEAFGLLIEPHRASVLVFRRGEWVASDQFGENSVLKLDDELELEIREKTRRFENRLKSEEEDVTIEPQLWFDASGIATAKTIVLSSDRQSITFDIARDGAVNVSVQ